MPEGVTAIPQYAFYQVESLKNISLPSTLTTIGPCAFRYTSGLRSCIFPRGLTEIGNYAFADSALAYTLTLPQGLSSLGSGAFLNCIWLRTLDLGGLRKIPADAFNGCQGLVSVTLSTDVTEIESYAFANCTNLEHILIPASVTTINDYAFYHFTDWKLKIYGIEDSAAQTFALSKGIPFVPVTTDQCVLGHQFGEWTIEREATFDDTCLRQRQCVICGFVEVEELPPLIPVSEAAAFPLAAGESVRLHTEFVPADASITALNWVSSNASAVSVSADGTITRLGDGNAVITVSSANGSREPLSYEITVTADNMPRLVLPAGVREIEEEAWSGGVSVQVIDLRAAYGVHISSGAFRGTGLRKVLLCAGTVFEEDAFAGCEEVVFFCPDVQIPASPL